MPGAVRNTKAGVYYELGGGADLLTKAGVYYEYSGDEAIGAAVFVTMAGVYYEYEAVVEPEPEPEPGPSGPAANREPVFHAHLENPDFSALLNPRFDLRPLRWSWTRPGGCDRAEIEVIGSERNVWQSLPSLLRSPVTIYNNNHSKLWWGYVHEVQLYANDMIVGLSLDGLYNRVALSYNQLAGGGTSGTPTVSAWSQDADSVARFGQKELLATYGDATSDQADAIVTGLLNDFRYVLPDVRAGGSNVAARLICRGWWHTLGWRYYDNANTAEIALTDQIDDIIAAVGEFVSVTDIKEPHTIDSNEYRDGTETAQAIIAGFLGTPLANGDRVTGWVTADRRLRVDLEGESGDYDWLLLENQQFRHYLGNVPDPGREIIGWTQLRGVLPVNNWGYMLSPSPLYIVENEFDASTLRYNWRARGALSPWLG